MAVIGPAGNIWTDREIDLIVADYFDMLAMDLRGEAYVKAHRNAALQELSGRSRGSIEYKHQNVSAVLRELGEPWIPGYKPMANYQGALVDGVERYLDTRGDPIALVPQPETVAQLAFDGELYFEPPPATEIRRAGGGAAGDAAGEAGGVGEGASAGRARLRRLVGKFDPAARDARNRALGKLGEERVLRSEHARLRRADRPDLARRVTWISEEEGDGAGYDILSFDTTTGAERLLEVKTTRGGSQRTPFFLTENERALSDERPDAFRLVRLYDFLRTPKAFELVPPLADSVILKATAYRAEFPR